MILRRAVYWAQFGMAVLLPVWLLASRGILADESGWLFVIYLVLSPVLFLALAALTGLMIARKRVRSTRAVSWVDAASLLVIWAVLFSYGLFAIPLLALVAVAAVVAGFWVAIWQLVTETRSRVKGFFDAGPRQIPDLVVVPDPRLSR